MDRIKKREKDPITISYELLDTYTELLRIDKNDLDTALVEQSTVYYRVGEAYADAMSNRDFSKAEVDKAKANADKKIRNDAQVEGTKLTEAQVANLILEDIGYQMTMTNFLEWKLLADKWLALRDSFNQRAYALRDLVQLFSMSYYDNSIVKAETANARDRIASGVRTALAEGRRKRQV